MAARGSRSAGNLGFGIWDFGIKNDVDRSPLYPKSEIPIPKSAPSEIALGCASRLITGRLLPAELATAAYETGRRPALQMATFDGALFQSSRCVKVRAANFADAVLS
jgi:hypothetical protein